MTMMTEARSERIDNYLTRAANGFGATTSDVEPAVWRSMLEDLPEIAPLGWAYPLFYEDGEIIATYSSPVIDEMTGDLDEQTFVDYMRAIKFLWSRFVHLYVQEPDLAEQDQLVDVVEDDLMVSDHALYRLFEQMKERANL